MAHLLFVNKTVFAKESRGTLWPYIIKTYCFIDLDTVSGDDTFKGNGQSGQHISEFQVKAELQCKFCH